MEWRVRLAVREIVDGLNTANDTENIVKWLHAAKCLTKSEGTGPPNVLQKFDDVPFAQLCRIFRERHFTYVCNTVLDLLTVQWLRSLPVNCFNENVEVLFLYGPAAESLMVLEQAISKSRRSFKLQKIITLLETFLKKGRLLQVIWEQCQVGPTAENPDLLTSLTSHGGMWDVLITTLTSLPSRMTNCLGRETSDVFLPQNYVPSLASCILQCLQRAHALLADSKECSLDFISRLVGKLCLTGNADGLLDVLVPVLCSSVASDSVWCQVSQRVFMGVPLHTTECVIAPLLAKVPWYMWIEKLLGENALSFERVHFLMCTKMLFHRYFSEELLLQNLIGYLASSPVRRALYREVFMNLLRVWGDACNLRLVPSEQHLFLCRALMICISHLEQQEPQRWKRDMIQLMIYGMHNHMASSEVSIRSRGMLVATFLIKTLTPDGPQLDFEIRPTSEIEELKKLLVVPTDPGLPSVQQAMENLHLLDTHDPEPEEPCPLPDGAEDLDRAMENVHLLDTHDPEPEEPCPLPDGAKDLDSDDDLVPYDMSFDKKLPQVKAPKYLRDCMEGLLDIQEVDTFEVSLQTAETLIYSQPDGLKEIAAEFASILVHSTENCGIKDFVALRMKAMVALAVQCPKEVAQYLTSQFYERNYNIRQRLDILEVLTAAAQKLSKPDQPETHKTLQRLSCEEEAEFHVPRPETWRDVVQRRIDSKTRRFGKGCTQPEPVATANRFGSEAGEFFYPLMAFYDRGERFFDILGDDSLVLNRLVYSLAIILHAAENTTAARQMGKRLLEFTWGLRNHRDVTVRQAVLVATSMVVLVVPSHYLLTDLQVDIMETRMWLEETVIKEVNEQCKELAVQGLRLLEATIAKEVQSGADNN